MVAYSDSQTSRQPPEKKGDETDSPTKHEESRYRANMKNDHRYASRPVDSCLSLNIGN
jgi:hypothetical protein